MPGPLEGVRVLDLSAVVSGPLCAALLGDQGAEVVKVERLDGDIQRHVGSKRNGFSGMFHVLNRGKRSIALDLGKPEGREIVHTLAKRADVVIQNFRPGVTERLGVGYADLSALNPRLVYLSISGFGPSGPQAGRRAYDPIIQAFSGIASVQGARGDRPLQVNQLILDKLTAMTGAQAISSALFARERNGRGQHITLSMLDTAIAFMWLDAAADRILLGDDVDQRPPIGASGFLARYADGFGCTMTLSDHEFAGFCRALDLPELASDPRFGSVEARMSHRADFADTLEGPVAAAARKLTLDEADKRFAAEQVPFALVRGLDDLPGDEQVQNNEMFVESAHPVAGPLREARPAPRFGETPAAPGAAAPTIGQHTREILEEIGMRDRSEALAAAKVVGLP